MHMLQRGHSLSSQLPGDYVWPHREGLTQALAWASINWVANVQVDVCYHLSQRLERWIVLRLAPDLGQQIPQKGLWRIACRIVETLAWKESRFCQGKVVGPAGSTPPNYVAPATLDDLLGENVVNSLQPPLNEVSRKILWRLFTEEILKSIGTALPMCTSKFRETTAWQIYYPLHLKMIIDLDQLAGSPLSHAEPANRPSRGWLRREVEKIALSERTTMSQTLKAKTMSWLLQMIVTQQVFIVLILPQKEMLEKKAQGLLKRYAAGPFARSNFLALLEQIAPSPLCRNFPSQRGICLLITAFFENCWRSCGVGVSIHSQVSSRNLQGLVSIRWQQGRKEFDNNRSEWWCRLFRLHRIQGIQVPGIILPAGLPSRQTERQFDFYMSTDGVGASFICRRPRRTPGPAVNPATVPFSIGSSTFVSIDPGVTDLAVGIRAELTWPCLPDSGVNVEGRGLRLKREALDRGVDVGSTATTLPTSKTAQVALCLDHARESVGAFHILFEHYKDERTLRWKTYCREQKALHSICLRVKGNKRAKKEAVVVSLWRRSVWLDNGRPVKKLRKHLRRYATVVPVDEFRTSRVCSRNNGEHRERTGLSEEEDEGGGARARPELVEMEPREHLFILYYTATSVIQFGTEM
ncbi:hypothetical protein V1515DRAFT_579533 [Lipomyces mesembrius]